MLTQIIWFDIIVFIERFKEPTSIIWAVVVVVTITGIGWWDLTGIVALLLPDGWVEFSICCVCSKGDWGGDSKSAVDAVLFGVVGKFCCCCCCCRACCWIHNFAFAAVSFSELQESKHCAEEIAAPVAVAPPTQANDDKPVVEEPSNEFILESLKLHTNLSKLIIFLSILIFTGTGPNYALVQHTEFSLKVTLLTFSHVFWGYKKAIA